MTDSLRVLAGQLARGGVASPAAEARILLAHVTGVPADRLFLVGSLPDGLRIALDQAVARRLAGEPLQHVTGEAWFRRVRLEVGPGVFVPRPETESLAGWAIDQLHARGHDQVVVELCAGSGAISLAIADEAPGHRQYAVELGEAAHGWATRNLAHTGVDLRLGDMAEAFGELDGTVDLLVVNPPYVPTGTVVAPEVEHDPGLAVFSGADGLDAIRVVRDVAVRLLRPGGALGCEHDESHDAAVREVFSSCGLRDVRTHADLVGRPRFTTAMAG